MCSFRENPWTPLLNHLDISRLASTSPLVDNRPLHPVALHADPGAGRVRVVAMVAAASVVMVMVMPGA